MKSISVDNFSPMYWLSSLGAGGISVIFFAFLNYTVEHGKGLINITQTHSIFSGASLWFLYSAEVLMALFIITHFMLSAILAVKTFKWWRTGALKKMVDNPLVNTAVLAPFISVIMSMNVLIGPIRYYFPLLANNLQSMILPGFIFWAILWVLLMRTEIVLLKKSFVNGFDINKIHFGWLLHPFALGMLSVTGAGIAAMSNDFTIANVAAFMVLTSASMGVFLLVVKMVTLFKRHFASEGLPEKQFLPSLLIVVPNITLYAITFFRLGHFLEHHHGANLGVFFMVLMTLAFAFETWYLFFGISLLKDYFRKEMREEFDVSQWGLVCPFVAYAVLGSFVYAVFAPIAILYYLVIAVAIFTIFLFTYILRKQYLVQK